ncbi:hypothetical protein F5877DRAFT_4581, partial [Lentinula edodes]
LTSPRHLESHPSPPNAPLIATLSSKNLPTTSVSSLDRSFVSTPPIRRSSPHSNAAPQYYNSHPQPPHPPLVHHHRHYKGYDSHKGSYPVPNTSQPLGVMGMTVRGLNSMPSGRERYGLQMPGMPDPGGPVNNDFPVVYTEDAATKLSDLVQRRCFNCRTTGTCTWRRSKLSPGKLLCNKCGLFERTHSRPRPAQLPNKLGPRASIKLHTRSPPVPRSLPSPLMHSQSTGYGSHPQESPTMHRHNTLPPIHLTYSHSHPLAPLS